MADLKGGHVLTRAQWARLEPALGAAEIQLTEDLVIAPVREDHRDGSMPFTNHSCDPNLAIQGQITGPPPTTATSRLRAAAEARAAGAPSPARMKPELQARYRGWFCWFLQRRIDAASSR